MVKNPFAEVIERIPVPDNYIRLKGTDNKELYKAKREKRPLNPSWKVEAGEKRVYERREKENVLHPLSEDSEFDKVINWWRNDPATFMREILGIDLWSKQREIVESVRDNSRTTVRSASAVGKTLVSACIALWFLVSFSPATVLTTGRSFRQVKEQLWREIRSRHAQAKIPLGGNITQTSLTLGDDWFALGFSTDEPERITGFHNKHVLVIVDEASGIPDEVYGAIENPLSAGFTRLLLLGNPTQSVGKFRDSFTSKMYNSFHRSAFDTPSFTGEGDFPFLIGKNYVEEKKIEWGEDSPLYEVYILGNFPSGETDRLIPFGLAEMAINRTIKPDKEDEIALGADLSRMGEDESVIYVRQGKRVVKSVFWKKKDTEAAVGKIIHELNWINEEYGKPCGIINIDEGYNPGVVDGVKSKFPKVNAISFQGKAKNTKQFANARAEMYWELALEFKDGTIDIPNEKLLLKQITDIKLKDPTRVDQILIESKESMKHRGQKSPDRADALALCFYEPRKRGLSIRWI